MYSQPIAAFCRRELARHALTLSIAGLCQLVQPAFAEDSTSPAPQEVIVTGSRIARPDLTSPSPITVVNQEFLQQKGTVNVEEVLNQLPQVVPGFNAQVNNGGDGTATIDLRGLGPTRTLALVNGRRFVPATNTGRIDLNAIPAQLIERVDVVTGGASAVYGSDALSGVVNFMLKDDFQGFELGTRYGRSAQSDGQNNDAYVLLGSGFADGRGNATLAATFTKRHALFQGDRPFSRVDLNNGSATGPAGRFDNSGLDPFPTRTSYAFNADGSVRPFVDELPENNGGVGDRYNFAPTNYLVTPQTRYTLTGISHYDVTDQVRVYAEVYYISNGQDLSLAPTPSTDLRVPVTNPLLSDSARQLLASRPDPTAPAIFRRRMLEFGARQALNDFNTTEGVLGLKGKIFDSAWQWDSYYSFGRTDETATVKGDLSRERLNASLAGCPTVGGLQLVPGCRVVDFFGPGKITAEDVRFLRIEQSTDTFRFDRHLAQASVTGPFGKLPGGDIQWAFGYEHRQDQSDFSPSESSQRGDLAGFNPAGPISGGFRVSELYGEVNLPLLSDLPAVRMLEAGLAARYSDYSSVGGLSTYTGRLEWKPIDTLRLRGTYSKASRAPSVYELFQGGDTGFLGFNDPCALRLPSGRSQQVDAQTRLICQLQGVPGGTSPVQTNSQARILLVGNPNLAEEDGKTYTFGVVWQPEFVRNLSATVDYFHIRVDGYIARLGGGLASQIDNCFSSGVSTAAQYAADPFCSTLSRSPSGELVGVQTQVNGSMLTTDGFDVALNYGFGLDQIGLPASAGHITLRLDASRLNSYEFDGREYAGLTSQDFATLPHNRGNARVVYDRGAFQTSLNWQYIGSVSEGNPGDEEFLPHGSVSYFDLFGRYAFGDKLEVAAGVTNLLDKEPPIILTGITASNTDNTTFDGIGRRYFVSTRIRF